MKPEIKANETVKRFGVLARELFQMMGDSQQINIMFPAPKITLAGKLPSKGGFLTITRTSLIQNIEAKAE